MKHANGGTPRFSGCPRGALVLALLALASLPGHATFHRSRIAEVFTGSPADPTAQYVVLMAYADHQNELENVAILVFDSNGEPRPHFGFFTASMTDEDTYQRKVLIATPAAAALFGVTPDLLASGNLPSGGLVCFGSANPEPPLAAAGSVMNKGINPPAGYDNPDCMSYGNYTGDTNVAESEAGPPVAVAPAGSALVRDLGDNGILQSSDDTDDSSVDFYFGFAAPKNFSGVETRELQVSWSGGVVVLDWEGRASTTIHKSGSAATIRTSAEVGTATVGGYIDDDPDEFPLSFYLIKP